MAIYDSAQLTQIKTKFEQESVLTFTHEIEKDRQLSFLDCLIKRFDDTLQTSVFVKDTNAGDCLNYKSVCPDRYKTGVIKTLLHRGYHVSSNSDTFQKEVQRIRQLLTDNNFPINLINKTIDKFIASRETARVPAPETYNASII